MKIKFDIKKDMIHAVDMHLSPLEFLVVHAILTEALENSTDADETFVLGKMMDEIDEMLEKEVFEKGDDYGD